MRIVLAAVATVLIAGSAVAGPCETAKRGTYLSNVCWLFEEFPETSALSLVNPVIGTDRERCTVTLEHYYTKRVRVPNGLKPEDFLNPTPESFYDWKEVRKTESVKLFLNNLDMRNTDWQRSRMDSASSCLRLRGKGIHKGSKKVYLIRDTYVLCGRMQRDRVERALFNLYVRYCREKKPDSEF